MPRKPIPMSKILAIDFETANRKRASACALGICTIDVFTGDVIEKRQFLINPETDFDYFNTIINGITPDTVDGAPCFPEILPEITSRIDGQTIVVAHNASFDISVLRRSCERYGCDIPSLNFYCTHILSKALIPGLVSYSLPVISEKCGVPPFTHHLPEEDAEACGRVFLHLLQLCGGSLSFNQFALRTGVRFGYINGHYYSSCHVTRPPKIDLAFDGDEALDGEQQDHAPIDDSSPFFNKVVVFTGALSGMPRSEAEALVVSLGGSIGNSVTAKTNYIICGYQDPKVLKGNEKSSKLLKAEALAQKGVDIQIVAEDDFFTMI